MNPATSHSNMTRNLTNMKVGSGMTTVKHLAGKERAARQKDGNSLRMPGLASLDRALHICANTYPPNRRKDMLSATNPTGFRITVSPNGFPVAICMSPDLTFALPGSRFVGYNVYWKTLLGHLDHLPRNMRRNGKFLINEDILSGADRVFTQVMYKKRITFPRGA